MQQPYRLNITDKNVDRNDVTKSVAKHTHTPIAFSEAQLLTFEYGRCLRQYYSHYLFYIEYAEYVLEQDLSVSVEFEKPQSFLFFLLEGSLQLQINEQEILIKERMAFLLSINLKSYIELLNKGTHRIFRICISPTWTETIENAFPLLSSIKTIGTEADTFKMLDATHIGKRVLMLLRKIKNEKTSSGADLDARLHLDIVNVIKFYNQSLEQEQSNFAYMAKQYIDRNFTDPELKLSTLAEILYCTPKTLINSFKQKFKITPHIYLMKLRMHFAHKLLSERKQQVKEVSEKAGYNDVQSFRVQFKKHFGYPPNEAHHH